MTSFYNTKLAVYMDVMNNAFSWLGVPLAPEKVEGPTSCITYLGIEIDSVNFTNKLPEVHTSHHPE